MDELIEKFALPRVSNTTDSEFNFKINRFGRLTYQNFDDLIRELPKCNQSTAYYYIVHWQNALFEMSISYFGLFPSVKNYQFVCETTLFKICSFSCKSNSFLEETFWIRTCFDTGRQKTTCKLACYWQAPRWQWYGNRSTKDCCGKVFELMQLNDCPLFQRLKQLTKRQVDLNFEQLVQKYQAKQKEQEDLAFKAKYVQTPNALSFVLFVI